MASKYDSLINKIDGKSIINNSLQQNTTIENKEYPKGMKVSKIFRKIMNDYQFKTVDRLYSSLLQRLFVKGDLCISINPLDYLTMGDNGCNWSSCHSLYAEFCGGIFSLLTDRSTALCYLESSKPFNLFNTQVSNKKWRQLIHIHPEEDYIIFNTPYPFEHKILYREIVNKLSNLFDTEMKEHILNTNEYRISQYFRDYEAPDEPLHFNDLLLRKTNGKYENDSLPVLYNKEILPQKPLIIGFPATCPVCGIKALSTHKAIECDSCNPLEYCCTCAHPFHKEELHNIDSELYCDTCFDSEFTYCDRCDEIVRRNYFETGNHICNKYDDITIHNIVL